MAQSPGSLTCRLVKRADFLAVKAAGLRYPGRALTLQAQAVPGLQGAQVGFTCAKRTFITAVASNRGRRRLKAAWQQVAAAVPGGYRIVLVGRLQVLELDFKALLQELAQLVARLPAVPPAAPPSAAEVKSPVG